MRNLLNDNAVWIGVSGTLASLTTGSLAYFAHEASVWLGFIGAVFSAGSAIFTFCIVFRRWRVGKSST